MEIKLSTIGVKDAAAALENLALVMQDSAERGNTAPEIYASAFELVAALASAIRRETEAAA